MKNGETFEFTRVLSSSRGDQERTFEAIYSQNAVPKWNSGKKTKPVEPSDPSNCEFKIEHHINDLNKMKIKVIKNNKYLQG